MGFFFFFLPRLPKSRLENLTSQVVSGAAAKVVAKFSAAIARVSFEVATMILLLPPIFTAVILSLSLLPIFAAAKIKVVSAAANAHIAATNFVELCTKPSLKLWRRQPRSEVNQEEGEL